MPAGKQRRVILRANYVKLVTTAQSLSETFAVFCLLRCGYRLCWKSVVVVENEVFFSGGGNHGVRSVSVLVVEWIDFVRWTGQWVCFIECRFILSLKFDDGLCDLYKGVYGVLCWCIYFIWERSLWRFILWFWKKIFWDKFTFVRWNFFNDGISGILFFFFCGKFYEWDWVSLI